MQNEKVIFKNKCLYAITLKLHRQSLCHFDFHGMIDRPRRTVCYHINQGAGRRQSRSALFNTSKGQMHLSANRGQVHITKSLFTIIPYPPCLTEILRYYRTRKTIVRIIMHLYCLVNTFYGNDCYMRPKYLLTEHTALWIIFHAIHKGGHKITFFIVLTRKPSSVQ